MFNDGWYSDFFSGIDEHHARRRAEFEKLAMDPPSRSAVVGDRVLASAGVIGHGFDWERLEGVVIEVADTAYRVRFLETSIADSFEKWVHRFAVTDVLGPRME